MTPRKETHRIIIHCSDGRQGDVAQIRKFHMDPPPQGRGWEDIAYHYVIGYDGIVQVGREESLIGAHCQGENEDSIGICIIGAPRPLGEWDPTSQQLEAMRTLCRSLAKKYGFNQEAVYGHYEFPSAKAQGKTCPDLNAVLLRAYIKEEVS